VVSESYNPNKREIFEANLGGKMLFSERAGKQLIDSLRCSLPETGIYFKRNTPQLAADGIKGIRIQLKDE